MSEKERDVGARANLRRGLSLRLGGSMLLHVGPFPQGMAARKRQGARPSGKQTKFNQLSAVRAACIAELESLVALARYLGSIFADLKQPSEEPKKSLGSLGSGSPAALVLR